MVITMIANHCCLLPVAVALCATVISSRANETLDAETEGLIARLGDIAQVGHGYNAMFHGSQFLPVPESSEIHTLVLGAEAPTNSKVLETIVRRGFRAVPSLLKHIDDRRQTKVPPVSGMMWVSFRDEYDFNRRTRKSIPRSVNKDSSPDNPPLAPSLKHVITVGDLCFVALGQIVNRNFNAARYQPTAGLVVSSPSSSADLSAVVRADFKDLDERKHRQLLTDDFLLPDSEDRRSGAYRRLAFYYPEAVESLILKQLTVPTFNVSKIDDLIRLQLLRENSIERRKAIFDQFVKANGAAASDGILDHLFSDLDIQILEEAHRGSPPSTDKYPRALLIQLYGFSKDVSVTNYPYINTWSAAEKTAFIGILKDNSDKIDKAVYACFLQAGNNDSLALACMKRLAGKGYDSALRGYCERRIGQSYYSKELQEMLRNFRTPLN